MARCRRYGREIESRIGSELARAFQGRGFVPPVALYGQMRETMELMTEEMRQLAREDQEFFASLARLVEIYDQLNEGRNRRPLAESLSRQVTTEDSALPFDAGLAFEVLMGRRAWEHNLTLRTFTIAGVFGTIRSMRLKCDRESERLTYEPDAEWTIPDAWGACTLIVRGRPETSFALYEFN